MLWLIRVSVAVGFLGVATIGSEPVYAAEAPGTNTAFLVPPLTNPTEVEKVVLPPFILRFVVWGIIDWAFKEFAGGKLEDFTNRLCEEDGHYRHETAEWLFKQNSWVTRLRDWVPSIARKYVDKKIETYIKDEKTLANKIAEYLECKSFGLGDKVEALTDVVRGIKNDVEMLKRQLAKRDDTHDTATVPEADINKHIHEYDQKLDKLIDIVIGKDGTGGIKDDTANLKTQLGQLRKDIMQGLPRRAVKPRHFRKHHRLPPCACNSGESVVTQEGLKTNIARHSD